MFVGSRKQEIHQAHWLRDAAFIQLKGSLIPPHSCFEPQALGLLFTEVWFGGNFDLNPTFVERLNEVLKI